MAQEVLDGHDEGEEFFGRCAGCGHVLLLTVTEGQPLCVECVAALNGEGKPETLKTWDGNTP